MKPYWNLELAHLNKAMKQVRGEWLKCGSLRYGDVFDKLKMAKRTFRHAHRKAVEAYLVHLYNEIDQAADVNQDHFWRLVNA